MNTAARDAPRGAHSIRLRLGLWTPRGTHPDDRCSFAVRCLVVWVTIWIAVAAVSADRANHEVGELMDAQLAQTGHVLRQITLAGNLPDVVSASQGLSPIGHPYESMISFQLWREGKLISRFGAAPDDPLGDTLGLSNQWIANTQWRVFGLSVDDADETLYVGQSYAIRQELIEYLTLHALRPILWSMPLAVLLIWLAVTDGLRPLRRLKSQIAHRSADQLDPIEMRRIPAGDSPADGRVERAHEAAGSGAER